MTTFTKTFSVTLETGETVTSDRTYKKLDDKTFKHYCENPLGMDEIVRKEMDIPDNRYYTVSVWSINSDVIGVVNVIAGSIRTVTAKKISKSSQ